MRPAIGITAKTALEKNAATEDYCLAIESSGGSPVLIGPENGDAIEECQGLLVSGGKDVHPRNYWRAQDELLPDEEFIARYCIEVDDQRDQTEIALIRKAVESKIPILGICRGIQVLNVALGGSLIPDIGICIGTVIRHREKAPGPAMHEVRILPGTLLERLIGQHSIEVNSYHHQGITEDLLAQDLIPSAFSEDGLIEAVESRNGSSILAVQWHPERKQDRQVYETCKCLFDWLVDAAKDRESHSGP